MRVDVAGRYDDPVHSFEEKIWSGWGSSVLCTQM
jgi:hypothetical protein